MEKSSAEIANEIVERENGFAVALEDQQKVEQEILLLQREILTLQGKKKDYEIYNSKARHLLKKITIEIKLLEKKFWAAKNSGL